MTSCKDTMHPGTPVAEPVQPSSPVFAVPKAPPKKSARRRSTKTEAETAEAETAEADTAEATAEANKPRKPAHKAKAAGEAKSCKTDQNKTTLIISYGKSVLSATLSIFVFCITQLQTHVLMKGRGQPPLTIHL